MSDFESFDPNMHPQPDYEVPEFAREFVNENFDPAHDPGDRYLLDEAQGDGILLTYLLEKENVMKEQHATRLDASRRSPIEMVNEAIDQRRRILKQQSPEDPWTP